MLAISKLDVALGGSAILRSVSLNVQPGEVVCLIGRNGAGKTTLFKTIMGICRAQRGAIMWKGDEINALPTYSVARRGIGFSPEESEVFANLLVRDNIALPTWTRKTDTPAAQRIEAALTVFPKLRTYLDRGGAQLSGGERKMVSIARALALDPDLLLLDEPFEGLSPAIIPTIASGISSVRASGRAVLMAESNVQHVPEYVDRIFVIERGSIVFGGALADARSRPELKLLMSGLA